jgi:hypothetical protein
VKTLLVVPTCCNDTHIRLRLIGAALILTMALAAVPLRAFADGTTALTPVALEPPVIAAPVLPVGKNLVAFSKNAVGQSAQAQVVTKICHNLVTQEMTNLYVKYQITSGPCDEACSRDELNGTLVCYLNITRRMTDLRGCFSGQWQLLAPSGAVLAAGGMEGTLGCGTHRPPGGGPCEECKEPRHYEGKMTGKVLLGKCQGAEICATLAGTGPLQPQTPQLMSIEGVAIDACK